MLYQQGQTGGCGEAEQYEQGDQAAEAAPGYELEEEEGGWMRGGAPTRRADDPCGVPGSCLASARRRGESAGGRLGVRQVLS